MTSAPDLAQPLSFRVLLDEAARQTRRHFGRIYLPVAVPVALVAGLLPVTQTTMLRLSSAGAPHDPTPMLAGFFAFAGVAILWFALYLVGYGALLAAAVDALSLRPVSMRRAWLLVLRPRILGTLALGTLASALGTLFCLVPGIYIGLLFSFMLPVMVEEGLHGPAALRRSSTLARYNPQRQLDADPRFKVFVVFFVGALLGYVVNLLVQMPLVVLQEVLVFRDVAGGRHPDPMATMTHLLWLQIPTQVLAMLTKVAINLYVCFGLGLLFFDVKARKEGLDLEAAVARLVERHLGPSASQAPPPATGPAEALP